ncbi:MAG TPA: hypothetical protein VJZ71_11940 [Phycisphaerae bacterium]|nr:hypothetical protein [Phycisphaerae bacterium]
MTTPDALPAQKASPGIPKSGRWDWTLSLVVTAALIQVIAGRWVWSEIPLQTDTGIWAYFAARMLDGARLYQDLWESKPPGIFLTFAGLDRVFGVGDDRAFLWLDAFLTVAVCGVTYAVARRFAPRGPAVFATCFLSVVLSHRVLADWGDNLEKFVALFEMSAVWLLVARRAAARWLLIGLCCGLAATFKQTGVLLLAIISIGILARWRALGRSSGWKSMALCWLGAAIPWIGILIWLRANESLGAFWRQVAVHDLFRATSAEHQRWRILEWDHWSGVGRHLFLSVIVFGPALAACMGYWTRRRSRRAGTGEEGAYETIDVEFGLVVVYALAATLIFVVAPHGYGHYLLQAAPPATVLAAWAMDAPWTPRKRPATTFVFLIGLVVGVCQLRDHVQFLMSPQSSARRAYHHRRERVDKLVRVLRETSADDQAIMLWPSDHAVSYYAGRRTPLEICQAIDIFGGRIRLLDPPLPEVLMRLQATPPETIVDWTPIDVQPSDPSDAASPPTLLVPAGGFSLAEEPDLRHGHLEGRLLAPLKEWVRRDYGGQVRYGDLCTVYFRGRPWREWQDYLRAERIQPIETP